MLGVLAVSLTSHPCHGLIKHLSHIFTRLKIRHHFSINVHKHINIPVLAKNRMFVTWTKFSDRSSHKSSVVQLWIFWTRNQCIVAVAHRLDSCWECFLQAPCVTDYKNIFSNFVLICGIFLQSESKPILPSSESSSSGRKSPSRSSPSVKTPVGRYYSTELHWT